MMTVELLRVSSSVLLLDITLTMYGSSTASQRQMRQDEASAGSTVVLLVAGSSPVSISHSSAMSVQGLKRSSVACVVGVAVPASVPPHPAVTARTAAADMTARTMRTFPPLSIGNQPLTIAGHA